MSSLRVLLVTFHLVELTVFFYKIKHFRTTELKKQTMKNTFIKKFIFLVKEKLEQFAFSP